MSPQVVDAAASPRSTRPRQLRRRPTNPERKRQQKSRETERQTELIRKAFSQENLNRRNIDWVVLTFIVLMHVGCVAAPFFFSWSALGVCLVLHWLTCSVGICLGYHRYLAHRSFKLKKPAEWVVMFIGAISGEGSPLKWAATHRLHHQRSDQEGDPHSPLEGTFWSHILWLFNKHTPEENAALLERYAPELKERPVMQFFERCYGRVLTVTGLSLLGAGYLVGGWFGAVSMLLWGMCVRMTFAYHSTWFVNSATHLWGYRNYETRDQSRNLWWVALLAYGEGWHNNHHAHPSVAPAGHRWWEIDTTWWIIKALRFVGLAYDVRDRIPARNAAPEPMDA